MFESFLRKLTEKSLWRKKTDYLRKKLRISRDLFFRNKFEKGQILRKSFDLMETNFFGQTSERDKY